MDLVIKWMRLSVLRGTWRVGSTTPYTVSFSHSPGPTEGTTLIIRLHPLFLYEGEDRMSSRTFGRVDVRDPDLRCSVVTYEVEVTLGLLTTQRMDPAGMDPRSEGGVGWTKGHLGCLPLQDSTREGTRTHQWFVDYGLGLLVSLVVGSEPVVFLKGSEPVVEVERVEGWFIGTRSGCLGNTNKRSIHSPLSSGWSVPITLLISLLHTFYKLGHDPCVIFDLFIVGAEDCDKYVQSSNYRL